MLRKADTCCTEDDCGAIAHMIPQPAGNPEKVG